jgi:hypothetical protein
MKSVGHEAKWAQVPNLKVVGQYYCSKCSLELDIWYNQNRVNESCTGWYWEIKDNSDHGRRSASAGTEHVAKYEPDAEALDEVRKEGLAKFNSFPCLRSN